MSSCLLLLFSVTFLLPLVTAQPCNVQGTAPAQDYCGDGQPTPNGQVTTTCCWNGCTPTLSNGICDVQLATVTCTGPTCISVSIGVGDAGSDYTVIQRAAWWASRQVVDGSLPAGSACCDAVQCTAGLNPDCVVSGGLPASSITCPEITSEGTCTITSNTYVSCISPAIVVTNCSSSSTSSSSPSPTGSGGSTDGSTGGSTGGGGGSGLDRSDTIAVISVVLSTCIGLPALYIAYMTYKFTIRPHRDPNEATFQAFLQFLRHPRTVGMVGTAPIHLGGMDK